MSEHLANKIAAGEVVQRPASALKELLENSLDAGADQISVLVKKSGAELVQVIDNGCGMSREDAATCFLRHATSKIRSVEDLERIRTLGFRGEALASIAAVAQVELRTRRVEDETGTQIRIEASQLQEPMPVALPSGTNFAIRNLFYNVPARRNFLKSPATEFKRIVEVCQFIALSNPDVAVNLTHDDREIYRLPARGDDLNGLQQRIADLFEIKLEQLIPIQDEVPYLRISGFVSRPAFTRKTRGEQFYFVNKRFIKSHKLDQAVMLGYGDMLPRGAYPFFALFIETDPAHVDVNVHPTKTEVQFDDESGLFGFIRGAIKRSLGQLDISPYVGYNEQGRMVEQTALPSFDAPETPAVIPVKPDSGFRTPITPKPARWEAPKSIPTYRPPQKPVDLFRAPRTDWAEQLYGGMPSEADPDEIRPTVAPPDELDNRLSQKMDYHNEAPAWQIHDKYILAQTEDGFSILDQHAAHERILYERFRVIMENGQNPAQQLLFPHTVHLDPGDFVLMQELLPDLHALGFALEPLSGHSFMVTGVPVDVPAGREEHMLEEVLDQYKQYQQELSIKGRDNLAKSLACRAAIKTGKRLSVPEIRALQAQLMDCEMPYACPHGRPTIIRISLEELDKRFGRLSHLETQGTVKRGAL